MPAEFLEFSNDTGSSQSQALANILQHSLLGHSLETNEASGGQVGERVFDLAVELSCWLRAQCTEP